MDKTSTVVFRECQIVRPVAHESRSRATISIQGLSSERRESWDRYVTSNVDGTLFHSLAWRDSVLESFGHEPHYLAAIRANQIVGVLPLFLVESRLAGRLLVSVPYGVAGGVLADHQEIADDLWVACQSAAELRRCRVVDLRSERSSFAQLQGNARYVGFCRELPEREKDLLGWLPRKARAVVRHARDRFKLSVSIGDEYVPIIWRLYCGSMRRLGSINYPFKFFERLTRHTPDRHWAAIARWNGDVVAGLISFLFKDRVMPYFFGCTDDARRCGASHWLYFSMMARGIEHGYRLFDFGRSRRDNRGSVDFKRLQGFEPRALEYQYFVPPGQRAPNLSPSNQRIALAREIWKHVPLCITRPLGARIARHIPG